VATLRQRAHDRFAMADESDAGTLRRAVAGYVDGLAPSSRRGRGLAELVATELATNLLRHADPGGWVLARPVPPARIEFIAVDRGPGITDVAAAVEGRTPNPKGLGSGLAAVRRASSTFARRSDGGGTTVVAVVDLDDGGPAPAPAGWGGVSVGISPVCGDGWAVAEVDGGLAVAVVDGLGHGPNASVAADAALAVFAADPTDVDGFAERANAAMRDTRGGAVAVGHLQDDRLHYVAIGNINGQIVAGGGSRALSFQPGTLGIAARPRKAVPTTYACPPGATVVLWTDGLRTRVSPSTVDGLAAHHPAVVAATVHRDHSRERDDATIVVVRRPDAR
jgi:anti-sigma regulatory factor (Ser/Thr protein kinase)